MDVIPENVLCQQCAHVVSQTFSQNRSFVNSSVHNMAPACLMDLCFLSKAQQLGKSLNL